MTIEEAMPTVSTNGEITPAEVRPLLAKATAASLDEIQAALLDAAVGATRENWTTFTCPDCGKKHRAQVQVPDVRARVGAIEVLLREGLVAQPRPRRSRARNCPQTLTRSLACPGMTCSISQLLLFANQIESGLTHGGREAVRERFAELSDGQRQVLGETLAELARA